MTEKYGTIERMLFEAELRLRQERYQEIFGTFNLGNDSSEFAGADCRSEQSKQTEKAYQ